MLDTYSRLQYQLNSSSPVKTRKTAGIVRCTYVDLLKQELMISHLKSFEE